jgi:hypothetical protein
VQQGFLAHQMAGFDPSALGAVLPPIETKLLRDFPNKQVYSLVQQCSAGMYMTIQCQIFPVLQVVTGEKIRRTHAT